MIYINGKEVKPYVGDYKPLTVYKGTEKLAGWVENTTEISSNIRIENGYSTMKVKPFGKSEQVQTEQSSNLCPNVDSDKWVLSGGAYKEDGYIVLPQVGAKAEMVVEWNGQTADADGQYVIRTGAVFDTEDTVNAKYHINLEYLNANKEVLSGNGNADIIGGNDIWRKYGVVYSADDEHGMAIRDAKYVTFTIQYSAQFNSSIFKFKNPLVSKTSNESYVAFVPDSPSPDYPSEIENVSGDLLVKATARNILPRTFAEDLLKRLNVSSTDDYLVEIDGKNYFKFQAGLGYQTGKNYFIQDEFEENAQYVFKAMVMKVSSETSGTINIGYVYTDGTMKSFNVGTWTNMTEKEVMLTSDAGKTIKRIGIFYNEGTTYINLDKYILCKLEAGMDTSKLEYKPYKEQKVTFPLGTQKLMKDGYLGENGVVNKRKQIVLTGQENFVVSGKAFRYDIEGAYALPSTSPEVTNGTIDYLMCNAFKVAGQSLMYRDGKTGISLFVPTDNPEKQRIMIGYEGKTVVELKEWLAEQYTNGTPVIIEYETQEEETTAYTTEQQTAYNALQKLKTYRTVTNISNNQDTNMKIMYKINN